MIRQSIYFRHGKKILVFALALVPLIVWGGYKAVVSNSNDVLDWLPAAYEETKQYHLFAQQFSQQDFVVASWPDCTLDDPRLDNFARQLSEIAIRNPNGRALGRVFTGRSLLEQMMAPPVRLDRQEAIERLRGIVIGPNGKQTCAIILLPGSAGHLLEQGIELIYQAAASVGLERSEVRLGGTPMLNAALNRESSNSLVSLAALSGILGLIIAWICFRDLRITVLVLGVGVYSAAASLAFIPMVGVPMNAILITMVPLVYVTAVSGSIHLSNYYLDALTRFDPGEAPGKAVSKAALPLLLAAVTTMLGLASLAYSDLNPIRMFGIFSAVGVAFGSIGQFLLLPAAFVVWSPRGSRSDAARTLSGMENPSHLGLGRRFGEWVVKHWAIVLSFCVLATCISVAGLPKVRTSIQMMRLFSPGTTVIPMTRWLEDQLGATIPFEVILRFRENSETSALDRMLLVAAIHSKLSDLPGISGCLSAATFAPPEVGPVTRHGIEGVLRRAVISSRIKNCSELLRANGLLSNDADSEMWRISVRVRGIDDLDYSVLVDTLHQNIHPICDDRLGANRHGVDVMITGTAPIVFKARQSLLNGMVFGLGTDVLLIVVSVSILTRSLLTGLVMFIVSVFPTVLIFGSMGLAGVVVDIGTVMTPCVALGVTVDDVIHFLLRHRRSVRDGESLSLATSNAYATCGRAIVQSWGIIGVGLAAFALSTFVPTFRFGLLMFLLLTAGMLGNLLFLPSMLASPIGRWMAGRGKTTPQ